MAGFVVVSKAAKNEPMQIMKLLHPLGVDECIFSDKERTGFSHFVSIGSMLDVDFGDMIDYLGNDPSAKKHSVVYRKSDEFPQIHERRAFRVPDQTHHCSQIR